LISDLLLKSLKAWQKIKLPITHTLYHGCHKEDKGIDTASMKLSGNKWFSIDSFYAGSYCWHYSRPRNETNLLAKVELSQELIGVELDSSLDGKFPCFLKECFPQIVKNYELSKYFQNVLEEHIRLAFPNTQNTPTCFISMKGKEILIPNCEQYINVIEFTSLPQESSEYKSKSNQGFS
jgi:hypothetical protein